jgi:hypothetical protein
VLGQLLGDDIVVQHHLGTVDVLDESQDEVALLNPFRDFD